MSLLSEMMQRLLHGGDAEAAPGDWRGLRDKHCETPDKAWEVLRGKQKCLEVEPVDPDSPKSAGSLRFVAISDTHNETARIKLPEGDVLLHGGDFTGRGRPEEIARFDSWLAQQPFNHKVGNHDMAFDIQKMQAEKADSVKPVLQHCTYLEDSSTVIEGISIYGSPWQPWFYDWAFNLQRGPEIRRKWEAIPANVDILITHGPPIGHGDECVSGQRAGCVDLLYEIQHRIKPKFHVFGHIHEGYGVTTDGTTTFINASTCTIRYKPVNPPIVFDIALPPAVSS